MKKTLELKVFIICTKHLLNSSKIINGSSLEMQQFFDDVLTGQESWPKMKSSDDDFLWRSSVWVGLLI